MEEEPGLKPHQEGAEAAAGRDVVLNYTVHIPGIDVNGQVLNRILLKLGCIKNILALIDKYDINKILNQQDLLPGS